MRRPMRLTSTIPMPSASSARANASMPFVWSNRYEGVYDSPTGRWLAFGALNRLCVNDMRQLRHGRLASAEGYSQGITLRDSLWPNWMADHFGADIVRFCPKCASIGYHSAFHQIPSLSHTAHGTTVNSQTRASIAANQARYADHWDAFSQSAALAGSIRSQIVLPDICARQLSLLARSMLLGPSAGH